MKGASKAHPRPQVPRESTNFNLLHYLGRYHSSAGLNFPAPASNCLPRGNAHRRAIWICNPSSPLTQASTSRTSACTRICGTRICDPHAELTARCDSCPRSGLTKRKRVFQMFPPGRSARNEFQSRQVDTEPEEGFASPAKENHRLRWCLRAINLSMLHHIRCLTRYGCGCGVNGRIVVDLEG